MEYIDLNISEMSGGRKKVKVFCLSNPKESEEFEELLNSDTVKILDRSTYSMDKMGRIMTVVE